MITYAAYIGWVVVVVHLSMFTLLHFVKPKTLHYYLPRRTFAFHFLYYFYITAICISTIKGTYYVLKLENSCKSQFI